MNNYLSISIFEDELSHYLADFPAPQSGRKSGRPPRETPDQDLEEAQIVEAYISALAVIEQLKQPSEEEAAAEAGKVRIWQHSYF